MGQNLPNKKVVFAGSQRYVKDAYGITRRQGYHNSTGLPDRPMERHDGEETGGNGYDPPAQTPAPTPTTLSGVCYEAPSLSLISNTVSGTKRTMTYKVGPCVQAGYRYYLEVYSVNKSVIANAYDTPQSIVQKLVDAINLTTKAQWNGSGSAPSMLTANFPPLAYVGLPTDTIRVTLNTGNQFAGGAVGTPPSPPSSIPIAAPPPVVTLPPVLVPPEPAPTPAPTPMPTPGLTITPTPLPSPPANNTPILWINEPQPTATPPVEETNEPEPPPPAVVTNQAPIANPGPNQTVQLPANVTLDGNGSYDPENGVMSFSWIMQTGPNTPTISNNDKAVATVSGLVAGSYVFRLTVTDAEGSQHSEVVNVTVEAADPIVSPDTNIDSANTSITTTAPIVINSNIPYGRSLPASGSGAGAGTSEGQPALRKMDWILWVFIAGSLSYILGSKNDAK